MQLRYADGTPFPLRCNFLATIRRVVDACGEMLRVDDPIDAGWDAPSDSAPILQAIERVLPLAELPETTTSIRWTAGARAGEGRLVVSEATYFRLETEAVVDTGEDTVFCGPFRVKEVAQSVHVTLPPSRGLLGRRGPRARCIDRYFLVGAEASAELDALVLSKKRGGHELRVVLRGDGGPAIVDTDTGEQRALDATELAAMTDLWQRVVRGMWNRKRRVGAHLIEARLDGQPIAPLTDPAIVAIRLLGAIAPLYQEIQYRCGRADALLLHRERDEGRVATLMLPISELEGIVSTLPRRTRAIFAPLGLTCDAVPLPYVA